LLQRKHFNTISSLQVFQIMRFVSFLIISIVFTKSNLTITEIGDYEYFLFIASAVSFFWVTAIIQSFLPLYNNNEIFEHKTSKNTRKSPEIFNAFLLLLAFSIVVVVLGLTFRNSFHVYSNMEQVYHFELLFLYILLSNPACLVEYIYLLRNRSLEIIYYGFFTFSLQVAVTIIPVLYGFGLVYSLWGLIFIAILRLIWLGVLLFRYSKFEFSKEYVFTHLALGFPLMVSTLLGGSAQYVDGAIVSAHFDARDFALFRYGAKEFPIVVMMAAGLSNALLPMFQNQSLLKQSLSDLKRKSLNLMHYLFPISILLLIFANDIFPALFNQHFSRSADVFMVYILLITSRLLFPQTILIGLKKTRVVMTASIIAILINILFSLLMIPGYGIVGVAVATVIVFFLEKVFLVFYNYKVLNIKPQQYIPLSAYIIYSAIIIIVFVMIDHRIIMMPNS